MKNYLVKFNESFESIPIGDSRWIDEATLEYLKKNNYSFEIEQEDEKEDKKSKAPKKDVVEIDSAQIDQFYYKISENGKIVTFFVGKQAIGQFDKDCLDNDPKFLACAGEAGKYGFFEGFQKMAKPMTRKGKDFKIREATMNFADYLQMAEQFSETQPFFYTRQKIWWLWNFDRKCWEMVDEVDLLNEIVKSYSTIKTFEQKIKAEIVNSLKQIGRKKTPKDPPKHWIQFKDMIYDLKTDETFEATPEYFVTNPLPFELGEADATPQMDLIFKEWVAEHYVQNLYEIIAYCMLSHYPIHRIFCLVGAGRNGKGSYLKILNKFIGSENICTTELDILSSNHFESSVLYKRLVCGMGEINATIFKNPQLIKRLSGEDPIRLEFKGKDALRGYYNYAKLLIATNKLPETTDRTIGFYSRWLIIDFNNTFTENPDLLDRIPEQEFNNLARKSIKILKGLLKNAKFENEGDYEERAKKYEERSSPIREFLIKYCLEGKDYTVPFWMVYEEYVSYLSQRGFRKESKIEFTRLLKNRGFSVDIQGFKKDDGTDSTRRIILGMRLRIEELITKGDDEPPAPKIETQYIE